MGTLKITKKQKELNKKLKHMQTKTYTEEQAKKETNKRMKEWKIFIRNNAGNRCERCRAIGILHPHHILPKERYPEFKTEIKNGILLCPTHHKYGKFSAHRNPIWFSQWLQKNNFEKYKFALDNIGVEVIIDDKVSIS